MYKADFKAKSWDYIVEQYSHLASVNSSYYPMQCFASQVAASEYSKSLFPAVSMHTLLISQTPEFDRHHEVLEINFHGSDQTFVFEYWERPSIKIKRWRKECGAEEGFGTFERFLQLKKWFA
jgi:hypothetical protein